MEITLYLVGYSEDDASSRFPFDSEESARSYADDNPGTMIYTVTATIDFSTIDTL